MKWVTRERPKIDRIACPWLVARFAGLLAVEQAHQRLEGQPALDRGNAVGAGGHGAIVRSRRGWPI
jgi:hypothetical protein